MLIPHSFGDQMLVFEIIQPHLPDERGRLEQSDKWMLYIRHGTVSWFTSSPALDPSRRPMLFDTPEQAYQAGLDWAHQMGLED